MKKFCLGCYALLIGLFGFISTVTAAASSHNDATIQSIRIHLTSQSNRITEEQVRSVIPIKEGDIVTSERLNGAVESLYKWGTFDEIKVAPSYDATEVDFYLNEAVIIGDIEISGNYPYVEQKIRKYLTIRPGDIYTHGRIEEQIGRIRELYEREGFIGTDVAVSEEWEEITKDVKIKIKIKRGEVLRFGQLKVEGMSAIPKGRLVSAINPIKPYRPRKFNDAIRKVSEYYHAHGFPRARIEVVKREVLPETNRINVLINVTEGPRVGVDFNGNSGLSSRKLKKQLTIFEGGGFGEYEIEESVKSLIEFYHRNGYPEISINASQQDLKSGDTLIKFDIKEGIRERIRKINFVGNERVSGNLLKKEIKTKEVSLTKQGLFKKDVLEEDKLLLKKYYEGLGYLNTEVGEIEVLEDQGHISINIPIFEDGRTVVKEVIFSGNIFSDKNLLKVIKLKSGGPLDITALESDRQAVLAYYADRGYPYADVKQERAGDSIKYDISSGKSVMIGKILVVGNSLTSTRAIKKALGIKEGELFSYQKITKGQMGLRRMAAFNTAVVDTIGLTEKMDVVHFRVKVEEQRPFIMDFELAYSTDTRYSAIMNFTNINAFGMAKILNLKLTGGVELSRAETNWTNPRFLGSDFEMTTSSWLQYQDKNTFNYMQAGGGFGFFRRYHRTGIMAKYELNRNYFIQGDSAAADADSLRDNTISKLALSASFDTRNSFSDPTSGIFAMMGTDFFNEIRGNEANFTKLHWAFSSSEGFFKVFAISNSLRLDMIETLGKNVSVPTNELLFLGGDDTLRGFSEDSLGPVNAGATPIGGRLRWIYNAELRIKLFSNWRWVFFYDAGALTNGFSQIDLGTIRQSAGFGLRYMTPVGPIRADYGIILDRAAGEHFGRFHLTFGYVF